MLLWVNGSALDNQSQTGKAGRETESHEMTVMAETEMIIGATETLGEKMMVMVDTQVVVTETEALTDMRTGEEAETGETVIEAKVSKEEADRLGVGVVETGTHGMIATDLVHETSVTEMIMVEIGGVMIEEGARMHPHSGQIMTGLLEMMTGPGIEGDHLEIIEGMTLRPVTDLTHRDPLGTAG